MKAVVLLSGGLDSTTCLYYALNKGYTCFGLTFDYGQRHSKEIKLAQVLADHVEIGNEVVKIAMPWKGSSLLDKSLDLPEILIEHENTIPSTYVPARNIIFLSFALSYAEAVGAGRILIGANAIDYSGYPDCRPEFFNAFTDVIKKGCKSGIEGKHIKIETPLIHKSKAQIIKLGLKLNVPFEKTWSCYKGIKHPCGVCDSCRLRARGFQNAGVQDPLSIAGDV